MAQPSTVEEYLGALPAEQRDALEGLRRTIRAAAPAATETISYQMPAFRDVDRLLVSYAAFKDHCSLFPMSLKVIADHREELQGHLAGRGTIRFRPERPLPTQPDGPPAAVCDGPQVRVEVTPLDREAERQLILAEGTRIVGASDQGMTISHGTRQRSHMEIPDPDGTAREVTLRGPLVRVAGPWRLEIPLA